MKYSIFSGFVKINLLKLYKLDKYLKSAAVVKPRDDLQVKSSKWSLTKASLFTYC